MSKQVCDEDLPVGPVQLTYRVPGEARPRHLNLLLESAEVARVDNDRRWVLTLGATEVQQLQMGIVDLAHTDIPRQVVFALLRLKEAQFARSASLATDLGASRMVARAQIELAAAIRLWNDCPSWMDSQQYFGEDA